jgi:hypothetical protein
MDTQIQNEFGGIKYDQEKLRWSLLPIRELEQVVEILEFGAKKYAPENWKKVALGKDGADRYFNGCIRHLVAVRKGQALDEESHKHHLAHAICCLLFWFWLENETKEKS